MNTQLVEGKLREKLGQLEERLAHVKKDISKSYSSDSAEQAVERENDEVLGGIGQETQSAIEDIRAALVKIGEGTYENCSNCGKAINPERLVALPETGHCVACAGD
ncbi:MAG: TraR/DksA C4-type zinc finger protein [Gammaproteobacteria bacterium]|nr:TraR/DksA C4-type zinc finger protein [Gammaproteobacteria bacterium]MBL4729014.1 TraR/DksA C4-type zinc finger protein [Gammaproteobacteria bacterium]